MAKGLNVWLFGKDCTLFLLVVLRTRVEVLLVLWASRVMETVLSCDCV